MLDEDVTWQQVTEATDMNPMTVSLGTLVTETRRQPRRDGKSSSDEIAFVCECLGGC